MKKLSLLLAFLCAVTVFGGCAGKDNADTDSTVSLAPITVPNSIAVTKLDVGEEWVYDSDEFGKSSHRVPQFNVKAQGIDELNEEIVKKFKEAAENANTRIINYTFMVKSCLLSVCVEVMDNGWLSKSYAYNVSLGDGSLVDDARTMAAYCGVSDEEYRIAAATAVTNEYGSLYASFSDSNPGSYKENLLKNQSEKMTKTYSGYINERGELSFCGEMYGLDGTLRGFSSTSVTVSGMSY